MAQEQGRARLGQQGEDRRSLSLKASGRAMRAISGPAISVQRSTRVGIAEAGAGESGVAPACSGIAADSGRGPAAARSPAFGRLFSARRSGHGRDYAACHQNEKVRTRSRSRGAAAGLVRRASPRAALARAKRESAPIPIASGCREIMLQQTTVQAVAGYYRKFLERWPDVKALAAAKQDDVLAAWAGLGYYARARNLHAAAKIVAGEMGGKFPDDGGRLARAARRRRLYRGRDRGHRL